jgi:3',5'-cyclic-AMP phosphodiesterase
MRQIYLGSFRWIGGLLVMLGLNSCEKFEYSPHEVLLRAGEKNLNQVQAAQIQALGLQPGDTIRIALISDTQRFYDETQAAVEDINSRSRQKGKRIHFVIHGGDITDFGLMDEYRWIHDRLQKLQMPYLAVIGNHDCVGNGKVIFEEMYGPHDFSVTFARNRFVFLNTNSLEYKKNIPPHLHNLQKGLEDVQNYDNAFVIGHVPPFDQDFDRSKEEDFATLVRQYKVKYSIHGHQHNHRLHRPYGDGQDYLVIGSVEKNYYVVMTIVGQQVSYELVTF